MKPSCFLPGASSQPQSEIICETNGNINGANIGDFCVIAAGTIVEGVNVPDYSLVVGNPMIIKKGYYQK